MENKSKYENSKIEVVDFEPADVVSTSDGESIGTGSDNIDKEGWTPVEW